MKTADPDKPYQYYPGKDGDDFDLQSTTGRGVNFKLPVPKLSGGDNTFIALTGVGNECNGAVAPHSSNWVFPKVIKFVDNLRLNNWVQKNNVLNDGNKNSKIYNWGLKCSATNKMFQHRSFDWDGSKQRYNSESSS